MFSFQYFILDPKTLRFPCCRSFLGTVLVEEKPSEVRTIYILGSTLLVQLKETDWHLENSRKEQQLLAKSKHDFY